MTQHHEGLNFIQQISDAYSALQREPGHINRISELERHHIADGERIQRLELLVQDIKRREDELKAKLRSTEEERDNAGFRLLETEDQLDVVRNALGMPKAIADAVANAEGSMRAAIAQAKAAAEQAVAPPPVVDVPQNVPPVSDSSSWVDVPATPPVPATPLGERDTNPTVPTGQASEQVTASIGDAVSQPDVSIDAGPASGGAPSPFGGKLYANVPGFYSRDTWLAGGGTDATYDWRPGQPRPSEAV